MGRVATSSLDEVEKARCSGATNKKVSERCTLVPTLPTCPEMASAQASDAVTGRRMRDEAR